MGVPIVSVSGVSRSYGAVRALADVSFTIDGPGIVGILGPNGAGKTSLLDLLAGLAKPSSGEIALFGAHFDERSYPRHRVGVVLQREFVPDHMTVREYAELFAAIQGVRGGEQAIVARAELRDREKTAVARLSGGEAQRLFIAAACVHDPALLLLDEPTAGLDPGHRRTVQSFLRRLAGEKTIVLTTHDLSEAEDLCDRCVMMVSGELRALGTIEELYRGAGVDSLEAVFFHYAKGRLTKAGDIE
jgi:ABC-2 type transport system ATP-binding protein